jgi:hypothetical protein
VSGTREMLSHEMVQRRLEETHSMCVVVILNTNSEWEILQKILMISSSSIVVVVGDRHTRTGRQSAGRRQ